MLSHNKKINIKHLLIYIVIAIVMVVYILPLGYAFITSIKAPSDFIKDPIGVWFKPTFENYINAWVKANFSSYLVNSVFYMVVCVAIQLMCALFIAFPIARKYIKWSSGLYIFMMCGMFLPDGTIPLFQMILKAHLYNTRIGYILSLIMIGGVNIMFFTSYLKAIPKELDEAAIIDGAGYFTYCFKVVVPLSKPAISSLAILSSITIWNDIVKAIIFLSDEDLFPITKGLFEFSGQYSTNWSELMAALIMVSIPVIIIYVSMQKYIVSGLMAGSVKM